MSIESSLTMEDLCKRFPALAKKLLQNLDDQSLVIFKETSRDIYSVSTNERAYWLRIIQKYSGNLLEFQNSWKKVLNKIPIEILKQLATATWEFFKPHEGRIDRSEKQYSPLFISADLNLLEVCEYVLFKTGDEKMEREDGSSPLHLAAQAGHFEVYKLISQKSSNKYPKAIEDGVSPIFLAATNGRLNIYEFIVQDCEDKNQIINSVFFPSGWTGLHLAAEEGHLELCKFILENTSEKNPQTQEGFTPLLVAAERGHLDVCRYLINFLENKNPRDDSGYTPLDVAAGDGHLEICKLILENIPDKNQSQLMLN